MNMLWNVIDPVAIEAPDVVMILDVAVESLKFAAYFYLLDFSQFRKDV